MLTLRKSEDRGHTKLYWLDSKHTFSFGQYFDEKNMGFGPLRVINEDKVNPSEGFGMHRHRDMEILSYVLEGALEHKDSLGTGSIILPGDVQRMSAGTGIMHSEFNPLQGDVVHFLQIWIIPELEDLAPSYEQKNFNDKRQPGQGVLVASHDGRNGSLTIHQDASIYVLDLDPGQSFTHKLEHSRIAWAQLARGKAIANGQSMNQGDGAAIRHEEALAIEAIEKVEMLIFDMSGKVEFS